LNRVAHAGFEPFILEPPALEKFCSSQRSVREIFC
jgi:hypothetical protein